MVEFGFEKLDVWRKATEFTCNVYDHTARFPADETYGLRSQLRRASVSIASNIAEGSGRTSKRDNARFIEIAYGSVMEVVSQLRIATLRGFITNEVEGVLRTQADELARMLSGLRAHLNRS